MCMHGSDQPPHCIPNQTGLLHPPPPSRWWSCQRRGRCRWRRRGRCTRTWMSWRSRRGQPPRTGPLPWPTSATQVRAQPLAVVVAVVVAGDRRRWAAGRLCGEGPLLQARLTPPRRTPLPPNPPPSLPRRRDLRLPFLNGRCPSRCGRRLRPGGRRRSGQLCSQAGPGPGRHGSLLPHSAAGAPRHCRHAAGCAGALQGARCWEKQAGLLCCMPDHRPLLHPAGVPTHPPCIPAC